jgi:GTP-binding protein
MLRKELEEYNPSMLEKPFIVVLNKIDQEDAPPLAESFEERYPFDKSNLFVVSALENINLPPLKEALRKMVQDRKLTYA